MKRRHLAAAAALPVLLALPAAAGAQTSSTVRLQPAKSAKAGTTLRVAVGTSVPSTLRRARTCVVRVAGVKGVNAVVKIGVSGKNRIARVKLPRTLAPKRYRVTAACSGIAKRTVSVARVLPPSVKVTVTPALGPRLQGSLGTTSYAWAADVTNPSTVLDAYGVTVTVTFTASNGIPVTDSALVRRIPAGATITIGDTKDLPAGSAALTGLGGTSAAAKFGLEASKQPLPVVTPSAVPLSKTVVSGVTTSVAVDGVTVNSAAPSPVTRRSWIIFRDGAGAFVGAHEADDIALSPGANTLKFSMSGVNVPQDAVTATIAYEG